MRSTAPHTFGEKPAHRGHVIAVGKVPDVARAHLVLITGFSHGPKAQPLRQASSERAAKPCASSTIAEKVFEDKRPVGVSFVDVRRRRLKGKRRPFSRCPPSPGASSRARPQKLESEPSEL